MTPFTIPAGLSPGSTIRLAPGSYSRINVPSTAPERVTVVSADPWDRAVVESIVCRAKGWRFEFFDGAPNAQTKGTTGNGSWAFFDAPECELIGCGLDLIGNKAFATDTEFRANACNGVETGPNAHYLLVDRCLFRGVNHAVLPDHAAWGIDVTNTWVDQHCDDAIRMHGQHMRLINSLTTRGVLIGKNHVGGATTFADGRTSAERNAGYQEGQQWIQNTFIAAIDPDEQFGTVEQGMGQQNGYGRLLRAVNNLCITSGQWGGSFHDPEYSEFSRNVAVLDIFAVYPSPDDPTKFATTAGFRVTGAKAGVDYVLNQAGKHVFPVRPAAVLAADGNITLNRDDWRAIVPGLDRRDFFCLLPGVGSTLVEWCLKHGKQPWELPAATNPRPPRVMPAGMVTRPAPYVLAVQPPASEPGSDPAPVPDLPGSDPETPPPVVDHEPPVDEPQPPPSSTDEPQSPPVDLARARALARQLLEALGEPA